MGKQDKLPLEQDYQADIVANLEKAGLIVTRLNAGVARSLDGKRIIKLAKKGTTDLVVAAFEGKTVWFEVKRHGEKPSAEQRKYHARLRTMDHTVAIVESVEQALVACGVDSLWNINAG